MTQPDDPARVTCIHCGFTPSTHTHASDCPISQSAEGVADSFIVVPPVYGGGDTGVEVVVGLGIRLIRGVIEQVRREFVVTEDMLRLPPPDFVEQAYQARNYGPLQLLTKPPS